MVLTRLKCGRSCWLQSAQMLRTVDLTLFLVSFYLLIWSIIHYMIIFFFIHSSSIYVLYDAVKQLTT